MKRQQLISVFLSSHWAQRGLISRPLETFLQQELPMLLVFQPLSRASLAVGPAMAGRPALHVYAIFQHRVALLKPSSNSFLHRRVLDGKEARESLRQKTTGLAPEKRRRPRCPGGNRPNATEGRRSAEQTSISNLILCSLYPYRHHSQVMECVRKH